MISKHKRKASGCKPEQKQHLNAQRRSRKYSAGNPKKSTQNKTSKDLKPNTTERRSSGLKRSISYGSWVLNRNPTHLGRECPKPNQIDPELDDGFNFQLTSRFEAESAIKVTPKKFTQRAKKSATQKASADFPRPIFSKNPTSCFKKRKSKSKKMDKNRNILGSSRSVLLAKTVQCREHPYHLKRQVSLNQSKRFILKDLGRDSKDSAKQRHFSFGDGQFKLRKLKGGAGGSSSELLDASFGFVKRRKSQAVLTKKSSLNEFKTKRKASMYASGQDPVRGKPPRMTKKKGRAQNQNLGKPSNRNLKQSQHQKAVKTKRKKTEDVFKKLIQGVSIPRIPIEKFTQNSTLRTKLSSLFPKEEKDHHEEEQNKQETGIKNNQNHLLSIVKNSGNFTNKKRRSTTKRVYSPNMESRDRLSRLKNPVLGRNEDLGINAYGVNSYTSSDLIEDTNRLSVCFKKTSLSDSHRYALELNRINNEELYPQDQDFWFFGLFEGFGGSLCSNFFKDNFHKNFLEVLNSADCSTIHTAVEEGLRVTQIQYFEMIYNFKSMAHGDSIAEQTCSCLLLFSLGEQIYSVVIGDGSVFLSMDDFTIYKEFKASQSINNQILLGDMRLVHQTNIGLKYGSAVPPFSFECHQTSQIGHKIDFAVLASKPIRSRLETKFLANLARQCQKKIKKAKLDNTAFIGMIINGIIKKSILCTEADGTGIEKAMVAGILASDCSRALKGSLSFRNSKSEIFGQIEKSPISGGPDNLDSNNRAYNYFRTAHNSPNYQDSSNFKKTRKRAEIQQTREHRFETSYSPLQVKTLFRRLKLESGIKLEKSEMMEIRRSRSSRIMLKGKPRKGSYHPKRGRYSRRGHGERRIESSAHGNSSCILIENEMEEISKLSLDVQTNTSGEYVLIIDESGTKSPNPILKL